MSETIHEAATLSRKGENPSRDVNSTEDLSVSKGVDFFTFVSEPQSSVTITAPKIVTTDGTNDNFKKQNLQIDSANISGRLNFTGTLAWQATNGGATIAQGNEAISTLTGQLEGGTMSVMVNTPSIVSPSGSVSYGFYDAGSGIVSPLTNQDQLYVYTTEDTSSWLGDLIDGNPQVRNMAFQQLALPGAHDAGMFTLQTVNEILASPFLKILLGLLGQLDPALASLAPAAARRAITNLAITQKDNVATMLGLGIRYFDFRPGTLAPGLSAFNPGVRYHQHSVIPGYPYISFLEDTLQWLVTHPTEIVVISANTQGFFSASMNPTPQDLAADLAEAFSNTGLTGQISTGDKSSLARSIGDLLASNTRLIFLNQISSPPETVKYDSYSDAAYATLQPAPIIAALNGMNRAGQAGADYTVLQMQGTATAVPGVIAPSVLTLSDASSPLMATKGLFDSATNPWLLENVSRNLSSSQLVVFLNDFADNCMVNTAGTVSKQRMGLMP